MATRLIIDGNSVYEIDETCANGGQNRKQDAKYDRKQGTNMTMKPDPKPRRTSYDGTWEAKKI